MDIAIYVAIAENGVIGRDGGLPWRLSTDLKRFKADTMGKPIIMGRKTYEGIGRPLPGRLNIVVTRDKAWRAEGVETAHSLSDAIALANVRGRCMAGADEVCVVGGGEIYAQALPLADRLHVTHVLASVEGDAHFPPIDPQVWRTVSAEDVPAGEKDSHATRYTVYERRRGAN
ncbi:MAG: dihydrofolate reductase [Mesorhizobium sp.]|uniref:dihydrofolate reductase n=1 Tax=Mesorhizobium sp. TaxID=1871066 RepID=UPI000FD603D5|nr:dihydrofolate reductase [Mesorhizobium sp.]RVC58623.1 dihydrofolate reductase [Mesorhizobium sp. M4B.F.Ca.ET.088.02.2.1]RWF28614.1 MAG: dihydrofolate reductase [Mesorhizobium sp.]RWF42770.1 MAG: dihydrofolate reductase [Mesorhizobium sp.]TIX12924.1 MAG: dihydrofolate reductase [Mesorhizobium sp.]TIX38765.1 MAG: dihydrofolate reductase [Mesorhizobium sp.]